MPILKQLTGTQKWVLALSGLTLVLAVGNLGKAIVACQYAVRLPDLRTTAPLTYFAATGGFWGIVFAACAAGLAQLRDWGRRATLVAVTLHQSNVWASHLLFDTSAYARQATPRRLVLTLIVLAVYWVGLNLPTVREALGTGEKQD
mgnify:CR=1 FL=1